jgi:raffinose/stachyose/melibiose transport system substrate-binding protein
VNPQERSQGLEAQAGNLVAALMLVWWAAVDDPVPEHRWLARHVARSPGGAACCPSRRLTTLWHNHGTATPPRPRTWSRRSRRSIRAADEVVSQPADNYFDLLQAAAISKTGPDLATQWTGLFDLKYKDYLEPLNSYVSLDELKKLKGIAYSSLNFNPDDGVLVVPLEVQFYNGFYNKELFTQAGLDRTRSRRSGTSCSTPATSSRPWASPRSSTAPGPGLGGGFYLVRHQLPMMIYARTTGRSSTPARRPGRIRPSRTRSRSGLAVQRGLQPDVLTNQDSIAQFIAGEAAMTMEGTWAIAQFEEMGDKVDVFVPPFTPEAIKGVVEYGGTASR